ncbi:MAG: hypothetical protein KJ709_04425 [Nanoarchaeota archaeon]|nr:hypothetical protein [Nanoarchaeota archaeon]
MKIKAIKIQLETVFKIFDKHNVLLEEIYDVLKNDKPIFRKVSGNQYVAFGVSRNRYLTIFFMYDKITKEAEITTTYPSDRKQIKYYKKVGK